MYKYPEYNPQSVGGYTNPRDYGNTMGSPVVPAIPSVTTGMYDNSSFNFPSQTVGQLGNYYTPNVVPTPSYTPDMAKAAPSLGASFKKMIGLGGDKLSQISDGVTSAVDTAGANASTAWGKMSYGEKGTAMLGAATGLYGAYNARKTGKLAKEQFNFTKDSFNRNFEAQAKTTNAQLADRQNARHTRDPKAHASVSDYMKKYGV